ncbi:hypothetical protein VP01_1080g5 [Puccinia sorghi]|uniref:Uncharacterized protein n=1 Tax=Puccinia sorghi TaxID=27349 RepID=A0A0L6VTB7_9BASI|nr:hypothetical protein VP01_1080g5 [Puccinia sorghi]
MRSRIEEPGKVIPTVEVSVVFFFFCLFLHFVDFLVSFQGFIGLVDGGRGLEWIEWGKWALLPTDSCTADSNFGLKIIQKTPILNFRNFMGVFQPIPGSCDPKAQLINIEKMDSIAQITPGMSGTAITHIPCIRRYHQSAYPFFPDFIFLYLIPPVYTYTQQAYPNVCCTILLVHLVAKFPHLLLCYEKITWLIIETIVMKKKKINDQFKFEMILKTNQHISSSTVSLKKYSVSHLNSFNIYLLFLCFDATLIFPNVLFYKNYITCFFLLILFFFISRNLRMGHPSYKKLYIFAVYLILKKKKTPQNNGFEQVHLVIPCPTYVFCPLSLPFFSTQLILHFPPQNILSLSLFISKYSHIRGYLI